MISLAMITVIMGISFFANSKRPTYESVPYTVEEARVYVTDYGDCYHSSTCSYLRSSRNAIGKNKARSQGYYACSRCKGVSDGTISVTYYMQVKVDKKDEIIRNSIISGAIISLIVSYFIFRIKKEE